jgi:hypothetical protein
MSTNKHKHKLTDLRKFAGTLGLEIAKYSPGDGRTRYKLVRIGQQYFETDGYYRPATLSEAHAFLAGMAFRKHVMEGGQV